MIVGKPHLCLLFFFFNQVLGCGVISNVCWFHRSFLDELKACVISGDIEGIVCLTAVLHIILVINKGWLHFFLLHLVCYWLCPCLLLLLEKFWIWPVSPFPLPAQKRLPTTFSPLFPSVLWIHCPCHCMSLPVLYCSSCLPFTFTLGCL